MAWTFLIDAACPLPDPMRPALDLQKVQERVQALGGCARQITDDEPDVGFVAPLASRRGLLGGSRSVVSILALLSVPSTLLNRTSGGYRVSSFGRKGEERVR
jgi:hypothetical protein